MASITHDPACAKLTTPKLLIEHAEFVVDASTEKRTGFPDSPPVAVCVYDWPPTVAPAGAVDVNATVCERLATTISAINAPHVDTAALLLASPP